MCLGKVYFSWHQPRHPRNKFQGIHVISPPLPFFRDVPSIFRKKYNIFFVTVYSS
jgi:hypothetical protein